MGEVSSGIMYNNSVESIIDSDENEWFEWLMNVVCFKKRIRATIE